MEKEHNRWTQYKIRAVQCSEGSRCLPGTTTILIFNTNRNELGNACKRRRLLTVIVYQGLWENEKVPLFAITYSGWASWTRKISGELVKGGNDEMFIKPLHHNPDMSVSCHTLIVISCHDCLHPVMSWGVTWVVNWHLIMYCNNVTLRVDRVAWGSCHTQWSERHFITPRSLSWV